MNVLFSGLIDLSMSALSFFQPEALWLRILSLLFGCLILALGICIEVAPDVLVVPGEGIVRALAQTTKIKFGTVKVYFDVTLIVIAGILSLLFFQKFNGVGIGTVVSAIVVGRFVNWINLHFKSIQKIHALAESDSMLGEM